MSSGKWVESPWECRRMAQGMKKSRISHPQRGYLGKAETTSRYMRVLQE